MNIEATLRSYIDEVLHMSLATVADNKPWVCEVHFAHDDQLNIYYRSLPSRRHSQELSHNPQVAGTIVKEYALGEVCTAIYFEGQAEQLTSDEAKQAACAILQAKLGVKGDPIAEAKDPAGTQFYKISVENFALFAQYGDEKPQKYDLPWGKRT